MKKQKHYFYKRFIKRWIDIVLSSIALIILCIPMFVVAIIVRKDVGTPVFFGQDRIGKENKKFKMYKFRSMRDTRDENGVYLPDTDRITKFGRIIRVTSIDELPSLVNILLGHMSIIGPRPLPVRYLNRYTDQQKRRHEVRPGLSNPSVVNGRNNQSWESQFEGDVWYVDNLSFWVDLKSLIDTIKIVFNHSGATSDDGSCRGEFIGTEDIADLKTDAEGNYMKL